MRAAREPLIEHRRVRVQMRLRARRSSELDVGEVGTASRRAAPHGARPRGHAARRRGDARRERPRRPAARASRARRDRPRGPRRRCRRAAPRHPRPARPCRRARGGGGRCGVARTLDRRVEPRRDWRCRCRRSTSRRCSTASSPESPARPARRSESPRDDRLRLHVEAARRGERGERVSARLCSPGQPRTSTCQALCRACRRRARPRPPRSVRHETDVGGRGRARTRSVRQRDGGRPETSRRTASSALMTAVASASEGGEQLALGARDAPRRLPEPLEVGGGRRWSRYRRPGRAMAARRAISPGAFAPISTTA